MKWRSMDTAPKGGTEIILLFDSAGVDIVRLCWWDSYPGDDSASGWWSFKLNVTSEFIDPVLMAPVGWIPFPSRGGR
jgi:hypothetical protein